MTEDTYIRRMYIYDELEAGLTLKAKDLAIKYDVSETTIKNDMRRLTKAGMITVIYGRGGGYKLSDEIIARNKDVLTMRDYEYLRGYLEQNGCKSGEEEFYRVLEKIRNEYDKRANRFR